MIIVLFVTKWPTQSFNKNPFSSLGSFAFFYSALLFYFFGFLFASNPVNKEDSNVSTAKESNLLLKIPVETIINILNKNKVIY